MKKLGDGSPTPCAAAGLSEGDLAAVISAQAIHCHGGGRRGPAKGTLVRLDWDDTSLVPRWVGVLGFSGDGRDYEGQQDYFLLEYVSKLESNVGPEGQCEATDTEAEDTEEDNDE